MIGSAPFGHGPVASAPAPQSLHATPGSVGARKAHAPGPAPAPRLCPPAAAASSTAPGPSVPAPPAPTATRPLLVIDVTGRTGRRALEGLLAAGVPPTDISLLSSRPASAAHADLLARGMEVVGADLDSEGSLQAALGGRGGAVYIHALSADAGGWVGGWAGCGSDPPQHGRRRPGSRPRTAAGADASATCLRSLPLPQPCASPVPLSCRHPCLPAASADPAELERARQLGAALAAAGASHVVYNSSAGRSCGAGISQAGRAAGAAGGAGRGGGAPAAAETCVPTTSALPALPL